VKNQIVVHVKVSGPTWRFGFVSREAAIEWLNRNAETITFAVIGELE